MCEQQTMPPGLQQFLEEQDERMRLMVAQNKRVRELWQRAVMLGQEELHCTGNCKVAGGCYLCMAEKEGER
jgi:hypothetical protein